MKKIRDKNRNRLIKNHKSKEKRSNSKAINSRNIQNNFINRKMNKRSIKKPIYFSQISNNKIFQSIQENNYHKLLKSTEENRRSVN